MAGENKTILIAGGPELQRQIHLKWPESKIVGSVQDPALAEYFLSGTIPDILVVDPRIKTRGEGLEGWMKRLALEYPGLEIALLTEEIPADMLVEAGTKVLSSQTIVVWSPKGGVGKTFLATNLACAASMATGGEVALLDLDLYSGDVSVHLDIGDGPTVAEILPALRGLRPENLDRYTVKHGPSGLNVLRGPKKPQLAGLVTTENVKDIISLSQKRWGILYIDTPPDITSDIVGICIDSATKIVLVTTQDIAALRQCKLALDVFARLGIPKESVAIVLNRVTRESMMPPQRIEDYLGQSLLGTIPDEIKEAEKGIFNGKPPVLYSKSPLGDALWQLVASVSPGIERPARKEKPGNKRWGFFS